jgi:hypothetical protein
MEGIGSSRTLWISEQLPKNVDADFVIALVNVPIEDTWHTRQVSKNQIVLTFHEIEDILRDANIPLEICCLEIVIRLCTCIPAMWQSNA